MKRQSTSSPYISSAKKGNKNHLSKKPVSNLHKPASLSTALLKKKIPGTVVSMEDKSAEQLLEDLTGILSNRKELIERIAKKFPGANDGHKTFGQYHKQTTAFLSALVSELSAYGDGLAGPDPDNDYNDYWKAALKKWDSINRHRLVPFWRELESILRNVYKKILSLNRMFPASLQKILVIQLAELDAWQAKK